MSASYTIPEGILQEVNPIKAFLRLEEYYRLALPSERDLIRAGWDFQREWHIPGLDYSDWRCIVFSPLVGEDRHGLDAEARIEARLTYHAIENARSDFRDTGMDICLCYHAALTAGLDVVSLFEDAAQISDRGIAATLRGFLRWPPKHRSLWPMGFRQTSSENGIAFELIALQEDYESLEPLRLDEWGREIVDL